MWTEILLFIIVLTVGFVIGYITKTWLFARYRGYSGTIVIDRNDVTEKTVYSLVLDDYPEKLEFKKMVIFKVKQLDR
jgi:hypothetical protein